MSVPDEHIFPHATALALQTVEKRQEPQDLKFYAGWFCPFVQRVWITLEEKNVPYQYNEVNPYKKEKHFLAINPKGLVPAVEYQGKALYESLVLCEFIEDAFPAHTPHLMPADPFDRARVRLWADYVSKRIVPGVHRLMQAQELERQQTYLAELIDALRTFSAEIKGPYFLGEQFSLADVAVAPWVVRDNILGEHRGLSREAVGLKWKEYAELVEARDSVVRTCSDKIHYEEIYGRYLRDEAQSEMAKAIRSGGTIP